MVLYGLSFPVEGIVLSTLEARLQSSLLNAAQGRGGRSESTCGEHDGRSGVCRGCGAVGCVDAPMLKLRLLLGTEQRIGGLCTPHYPDITCRFDSPAILDRHIFDDFSSLS